MYAQQHALAKQWDKRFGGTDVDAFTAFQQTLDGGFIIGGVSHSPISGDKTQPDWDTTRASNDYWVVKIDIAGNKEWDKRFGGFGEDGLMALQQTFDGGYILGGTSFSGIGGDKTQSLRSGEDYWVVKIDSLGNKQWDKRFGGTTGANDLYSVVQTREGGYLLCGFSNSGVGGDKTQANWDVNNSYDDFWVVKIDSAGTKQWDKRFGGTKEDGGIAIQTASGGYLLAGGSSSDSSGDKSQNSWQGSVDYWIVKIDSAGSKQWDKRYGGNSDEGLASVLQTKDGGYLLGGNSYSDNSGDKTQNKEGYWIVKIDSLGIKQWDQAFNGTNGGSTLGTYIFPTFDGGYLLSGSSGANAGIDKTENSFGLPQGWVIKIDSLGNKQWDKTIFTDQGSGGIAIQTIDGCYALAAGSNSGIGGYKSQPNWDPTDSTSDYWIVKFCDTLINSVTDITETDKVQLSIYPNPFTTDIAIALQKPDLKQADFTICNTLGQTVYTQHETNLSNNYTKMLDLSYLPNGVYFVEVVVDWERVVREVVKE